MYIVVGVWVPNLKLEMLDLRYVMLKRDNKRFFVAALYKMSVFGAEIIVSRRFPDQIKQEWKSSLA